VSTDIGESAADIGRWDADVLLRDGHVAQIRPITPHDAQGLVDFYSRVSDRSKYYRFFAPYPKLTDKDVERFTNVDQNRRVAFVMTMGEEIIAIGRYDAIGDDDAEVAFLVQDSHQGRGIGQLLLEHLAQAGRERGIGRFTADVLPDNTRMLQIFREMGYETSGSIESGVQQVQLNLDPTETSINVMQGREHRAEAASIRQLFHARSVAVVGASRRADSVGQILVRNLVLGNYAGSVYAVNSSAEAVSGIPAFPTVADIPHDVDLAIVAVPAESVPDVVLDCAKKQVHGLIVVSAGFAEEGNQGKERQRRLLGLCRSYGLRLLGPNCLGLLNAHPDNRLNASLSTSMPPHGRVGFFSQSGALGTAILESVGRRGLGLSSFVSAGNRADVSGNDLLQYWSEDDDTEVVLLYFESIGNPRKFSRIARGVAAKKPVVAVKSGRSTQGVPVGHAVRQTSAPQAAVDAMFRQSGVIQVDTLEEMFDVAQLLAHQPLPSGNRIAVVGNSDAMGLLVGDAAHAVGLQVAEPFSLGADAGADDFELAIDRALARDDIDSLVVVYVPPVNTTGEDVANVLAAIGEQSDKPIVSTFLGAQGVPELLRVADLAGAAGRGSVPSYAAPEAAVRAMARVVGYAEWLSRDHGQFRTDLENRTGDARSLIREVLTAAPRGAVLSTDQVHSLLACYGIDLWRWISVHTAEEAVAAGEELGWNVVLKAGSEHLRARPDLAHVWQHISDADGMRRAWHELTSWAGMRTETRFFVQRQAPAGVSISFSTTEDPLFGPLVSFGVAGAPSDLLGDRAFGIPPLTDMDAREMISGLNSAPLLEGYRGADAVDVDAIEDVILRLASLKDDLPEVSELDIEPVIVNANGLLALSARAKVMPTTDRRGQWYVRQLSQPSGLEHRSEAIP